MCLAFLRGIHHLLFMTKRTRSNLRVANPVTHKIQPHSLRVCTHAGRQTKPGHFQCAMDVMRAEYDAKRGWHVVCANAR